MRILASGLLVVALGNASARDLLIDDFEQVDGWQTGGQKEIRFDLSEKYVRQGRRALHLHVEIDHHTAEKIKKVKYPMGWPSVRKKYGNTRDLSGYDFIEFDVFFESKSGIDPDFGLNATFKADKDREIYPAKLIDLRCGKWAHEKLCIRDIPAAKSFNWVSFWLSESSYNDGAVIDFWIDNLRATRATDYTAPESRPVRHALGRTADARVWFEGPCRKIGRKDAVNLPGPDDPVVRFESARNETEAVQVVVSPKTDRGAGTVSVEVEPLRGPGAALIPAENVTWSPVAYVPAREGPPEGLPDGLPGPKPFAADHRWNYPIWVEITTPPGTPAGDYAAPMTVHTAAGTLNLQVRLHVWDFDIPVTQHLRTSTTIYGPWGWRKDIKKWYGNLSYAQFTDEWRPKIVKTLARYRLCPSSLRFLPLAYDKKTKGVVLRDTGKFERFVNLYLAMGHHFDSMPVPYFFDRPAFLGAKKGTPEYMERITAAYRIAADYLEKKRWLDDCYVYCADEVVVHKNTTKRDLDLLNRVFAAIHAANPKIRIFGAETPSPILHGMDIWCMNIGSFDTDVLGEQHALGKKVWWYNGYTNPRPGARIATRGVDHRVLFWMNWKYGIDGYLIWTVNRWLNNPWKTPNPSNHAPAGDHFLLYPNPDGSVSPSIRISMMRDGLEDYEYHWLLAHLARKLRETGNTALAKECETVLRHADSFILAYDNCACVRPDFIYRSRRLLAEQIERARRALARDGTRKNR